jgi:ketosteroid isomerase-like protein
MTLEDRLRAVYAAFNARDIDRVLEQLAEDVDWPNAWEGGRVEGREGVREYWTRQWAAIDPHVEPTAFTALPDGRVEVTVDQLVRSLDGDILVDGTVRHVYAFRDGKVSRMDVMEPRAATGTAPA